MLDVGNIAFVLSILRLIQLKNVKAKPMDQFNLQRFVESQEPIYERVLLELKAGVKTSHWMWFIFPQIRGLGNSATAVRYAISGQEEAVAYLQHPLLGPRLRECTELVNAIDGSGIDDIFGFPDNLKFRSSMTLFNLCAEDENIFRDALEMFFPGGPDTGTLDVLAGEQE
jgi:uncharacterized protein (DUF1810 family)